MQRIMCFYCLIVVIGTFVWGTINPIKGMPINGITVMVIYFLTKENEI